MERTFKDLSALSGKEDAFELAWGDRFDESGISWDELLRSQRMWAWVSSCLWGDQRRIS